MKLELPKIKIVKSHEDFNWGDLITIKIGRYRHCASYNPDTDILCLSTCLRWAIFHELLHWWAYQRIEKRDWLNRWLDKPGSYKRINLIGF